MFATSKIIIMTNQIFKGETLTRTKVKNNILRIWELTDDKDRYDWYKEANDWASVMGTVNDVAIPKVAGVIAALSPLKTWNQNLTCARDLIVTGETGHMKVFVNKAKAILESDGTDEAILEILRGRKISSFYLNILYPNKAEHITIDRHALSIGLGRWTNEKDYAGMTANQYEFFKQCFVLAATKVGVSPLVMQSATWVKWREIKTEY